MFITTKITWSMVTGDVLVHEGFEYTGPLALACGPSKGEKQIAGQMKSFSQTMTDQAKTVFGNDSQVFNNLLNKYQGIVASGPGQQGFTQAELNALNSNAISNSASQFKNVKGAVGNMQAAYGGGNTVTNSGVTTAQDLNIANAQAAQTASDLNKITAANYETGRENFWNAAKSEQQLPSVFDNAANFDQVAMEGQKRALDEQKSLDAASGWWKKPVMGLVSAGLTLGTAGLGAVASGGSFMSGVGSGLKGLSGSGIMSGGNG